MFWNLEALASSFLSTARWRNGFWGAVSCCRRYGLFRTEIGLPFRRATSCGVRKDALLAQAPSLKRSKMLCGAFPHSASSPAERKPPQHIECGGRAGGECADPGRGPRKKIDEHVPRRIECKITC